MDTIFFFYDVGGNFIEMDFLKFQRGTELLLAFLSGFFTLLATFG